MEVARQPNDDRVMASRRVDREKTCPLLLRMFFRFNGHHHLDEFRHPPTKDELVVYTWKDATLAELAGLVKEVIQDARSDGAVLSFRLVYHDRDHRWSYKELGRVVNGRPGRDDHRTLYDTSFITGDFIDIAMYNSPPQHHVRSPPYDRNVQNERHYNRR